MSTTAPADVSPRDPGDDLPHGRGASPPGDPTGQRDAASWAPPVERLRVGDLPDGAINLNVDGRRLVGPLQGFGKLWRKSYQVRLHGADVTPEDVVRRWKQRFADYWPEDMHFYGPLSGIAPGEVAVLNLAMPGRVTLSTGVMVLYADERSFSFMNAEGHQFGGLITFSAEHRDAGTRAHTVARIDVLIRAGSPVSEIGLALFGHRMEDRFWVHTLTNLAADHGVVATPTHSGECLDPHRQWRYWRNISKEAAFTSALYSYRALALRLRR